MSSNLKIAKFNYSILPYKIVTDSSLTHDPIVDVTQGSGALYDLTLDLSTGINHNYYLKIWLQTASITVGTTPPDFMIEADQDQIIRMSFPNGIPFTALSAALVDSSADNSNSYTTTNNSGTVKIHMVVT